MYNREMPVNIDSESTFTRREVLAVQTLGILTLNGCLSSSPPPLSNRPPTIPTPTVKVEPTAGANTERLNPLFQAAVTQAEALSRKFPSEFADAKSLKDDLLKLQKAGSLLVQAVVDQRILATVRPQVIMTNGLIVDLKAQVYINPVIISFSPPEQVLMLTHELSHQKDQTEVLQNLLLDLKGKPSSPENISVIEREIAGLTFQMESKELFKNCRQLFALKSENPNFKTKPPMPLEQPLPKSLNRFETLYSVYLQIKDASNPEQTPKWKAAVGNFVLVSSG
ncbi:MAG: hypothetical protein HY376_00820 [Candidatus Blackburnbacteria bacterium]|nr:hypothetical protein [Candidatus Blackburnbacteria bacterium]